jgi:hypothetical protein
LSEYEVLSPWSEINPIPLKGISPRPKDLTGKRIGLFFNMKRAAKPVAEAVAKKLKERFPTSEITWYSGRLMGVREVDSENITKFEEWLKSIDLVVATVGD